MRKLTAIGIILLFVVGLIPLLWFRPGLIISNGDNIPPSLNADKTFSSSANMWSPDYLGYASPNPAYLLYTYFAAFLGYLGLSVGSIQIIIQILLYMGAGFSMYLFSKTIYPDHKIAPFFAAFFYMFNFFVLVSRFNLGFAWLYTFLPLLLALFVRIVNATYRQDKKSANIEVICFGLVSVVALSVASVNPANIALFLFALSVFTVYFLFKFKKNVLPFLFVIGKITALTIPINVWWMFPMLNTFIFSPAGLNSQVNVASWSWTHARASFLNLFWFNGTWGWLPEYVPFINYYSNPVVDVLTFVPFLTAGSALLFKSNKSRFNAYIMVCILFFLFLAKGLHYPFGGNGPFNVNLNLFLYTYVPLMSMFREPASKFTLLIIPFLALLIGYAAENVANLKLDIRPNKLRSGMILVLLFLAASFVISSLPLITGSIETKTEQPLSSPVQIPQYRYQATNWINKKPLAASFVISSFPSFKGFIDNSSYVQIPTYWFSATSWINNQPGVWRILLTPLDDFYQMNYTWGYYGSDQLLERLFEKPIVSTDALNGYVTNSNTSDILMQLMSSERFNSTSEFKALLDLLSIKYIVQRNDLVTDMKRVQRNDTSYNMAERNLKNQTEMHAFFDAQKAYLKLVPDNISHCYPLEVYEYTQAKPSINVLSSSTLQQIDIHIDKHTIIDKTFQNDIKDWRFTAAPIQSNDTGIIRQKNDLLEIDLKSSTNSWIKIESPRINVENESSYTINAEISANDSIVEFEIAEYSQNGTWLNNWFVGGVNFALQENENFDVSSFVFEPRTENTKYFSIQIWNQPVGSLNRVLKIDSLSVNGIRSTLNTTGFEYLYPDNAENQSIQLEQVQNISPQRIIATVDTTQPFVLTINQELDRFWVAYVNGKIVRPSSLYLGLKGFIINQTGQLLVSITYEPQDWFNYCLTMSGATMLILLVALVYLYRKTIKKFINKKRTIV
jgi:hypothetical protein